MQNPAPAIPARKLHREFFRVLLEADTCDDVRWAPVADGYIGRYLITDQEYREVPPSCLPEGAAPVELVAMPVATPPSVVGAQ